MHITGKILAWFVVIVAGTGTFLMARQLQIRNSYTKTIGELKEKNEENAKRIDKKKRELAKLHEKYASVMAVWHKSWDKRTGQPYAKYPAANPALTHEKALMIGIGKNHGVGKIVENKAQKVTELETYKAMIYRTVHVFQETDSATTTKPVSKYIGPFVVPKETAKQHSLNTVARVVPQWIPRAGEEKTWNQPKKVWRYRSTIPNGYTEQFLSYYLEIADVEKKIISAQTNRANRQKEIKAAQDKINVFRTIVSGDDGTGGIRANLDTQEQTRNQLQQTTDQLRRSIKKNTDLQQKLKREIEELTGSLPQPKKKKQ